MDDGAISRFSKSLKRVFSKKSLNGAEPSDVFKEEVNRFIEEGEKEGLIDEDSNELISSVLEFSDTLVGEIMRPRLEMVCISDTGSLDELINLITEKAHSKIPVYHENIDNVIGVINVLDLFPYWRKEEAEVKLADLARPPFFIPEEMRVAHLLREFQQRRTKFALVKDKYDGTSGLVTVEDIMEEIVGEIYDEYDKGSSPNEEIYLQEDGSIIISAKMEIEELEDYFKIEIEKDNFNTVSGLLIFLTGSIPQKGEKIPYKNLLFTVESATERQIKKVRVKSQGVEIR